jgi:outer membrane protein OmpA-like peptidoglycan-associated protein
MLLAQEPPTERQVQIIVDTLQRWLDRDAFDWLRALAVMPVVSPGYTLFCGAVLLDETIVTHDRFLALARLPWLRTASMPDWMRLALMRTMSATALERAAAVAAAFLDPGTGTAQTAEQLVELRRGAEDPARREALSQRLRQASHPLFDDRLLLGALRGEVSQAEPLDLSVREMVPVQRPRWFRRPGYQATMAAMLAMILLLVVQPRSWREQGWIPFGARHVTRPLTAAEREIADRQATPVPDPEEPAASDAEPAAAATAAAAAAASASASPPKAVEAAAIANPVAGSVDPVAPEPDQALRGSAGTLFLQIARESQRALARQVQARLSGATIQGVTVATLGIEVTGAGSPRATQLRCFNDSGCALAQYLSPVIAGLGIDATIVSFTQADYRASEGRLLDNQVELWFGIEDATAPTSYKMAKGGKRPGLAPITNAGPSSAATESGYSRDTAPRIRSFTVYFAYNLSDLSPEAAATLDQVIETYDREGPFGVRLAAFGRDDVVAERYGEAVRSYLVGRGVTADAIFVEASATSGPMQQQKQPVRAGLEDRRVDITLTPPVLGK